MRVNQQQELVFPTPLKAFFLSIGKLWNGVASLLGKLDCRGGGKVLKGAK